MANGKIRHSNHLIDQQACRYLQQILPSEWVQRTMNPDYGLDIDLELFDYEDGVCVTLGEHVYLQVKGTEHANYGTVHPFGELFYSDEEADKFDWQVLKFSIDVSELLLVERMGAAIPVLLIVVDLQKKQAFYVCLNDYIKCVLPYQTPAFRKQETVTIYIPTDNVLTAETAGICLWYGKRAKLFSLFLEILAMVDNARYLSTAEMIAMIKGRISELICSDAWHASEHWGLLESIHDLMVEMHQNTMINKAGKRILEAESSVGNDPKKSIAEYKGEYITAFVAAQAFSCQHFLEQISVTACIFEDDIRHVGLPTKNNWFHTKQRIQ